MGGLWGCLFVRSCEAQNSQCLGELSHASRRPTGGHPVVTSDEQVHINPGTEDSAVSSLELNRGIRNRRIAAGLLVSTRSQRPHIEKKNHELPKQAVQQDKGTPHPRRQILAKPSLTEHHCISAF